MPLCECCHQGYGRKITSSVLAYFVSVFFFILFSMAKVGEANMDLLIGARKSVDQSTGNRNLIRSRVVMFADLPGFKVRQGVVLMLLGLEEAVRMSIFLSCFGTAAAVFDETFCKNKLFECGSFFFFL